MHLTFPPGRDWLSRTWASASLAVVLVATLTGCSVGRSGITDSEPSKPRFAAGASTDSAAATHVVMRFSAGRAAVTLDDTPAAREFAAMLPLQLTLHDPMGQAKSGGLPARIDEFTANRVLDPQAGGVYYWPPSGDIAIFYDDLGQTVPPPGMVRLGFVVNGLDAIASAGNRFTVGIDQN